MIDMTLGNASSLQTGVLHHTRCQRRRGAYLIVAIRDNFNVADLTMHLDRSFIFSNRGINSDMKDLGDKYLYVDEEIYLRTEEETNMIRKIETGERK